MKRIVLFASFILVLLCGCNNSPRQQASDESVIEAKEIIKNTMLETNKMCPVNYGQMVMESVNYDYIENEVNYNYIVEQLNKVDNLKSIKEGLLIGLKAEYVANSQYQIVYDAIIKARAKMIYNYYTNEGKTLKIELLSSEIESSIHN